jgi:CRP-like cAMP-binding protein
MSRDQQLTLIEHLDPRTVSANERLIQDGESCDVMFFLWVGRLSIVLNFDRQDLIVGSVGPGAWVGEISVMDPGPACATVIAAEESVVLALTKEEFAQLEKNHPVIASLILQVFSKELASRLRTSNRLLLDVLSQDENEQPVSLRERDWIKQVGEHLTGGPS